jgi:hypothetical protein
VSRRVRGRPLSLRYTALRCEPAWSHTRTRDTSGSRGLLLLAAVIYVFAAAEIGIFLGTLARTMAQFALLMVMVIPTVILSRGILDYSSTPFFARDDSFRELSFQAKQFVVSGLRILRQGDQLDVYRLALRATLSRTTDHCVA